MLRGRSYLCAFEALSEAPMRHCLGFCFVVLVLLFASPLFAQDVPEIPFDSVPNFLKLPANLQLGEAVGVAQNSKGHVFVFTRSGETRLFEFDQNGTFVREIGEGLYAFAFAHVVRIDSEDNIWAVDEGTNMIVKFNPAGRPTLLLGRRPEAAEGVLATPAPGAQLPPAQPYRFNRPTDVAWDAAGNIFVSDGYGNSRVVKYDKNGKFIKSVGTKGAEPGQFSTPHTIATDAKGNVYVGDRGNKRIQIFDNDLILRAILGKIGAPWAICITRGPHQYLYSSNSNATTSMEDGEIYKMELDGRILGKFGKAGKELKEFGSVHEIDCPNENEIYVGEITNWRVQKLILHPNR
jgi:DNA-binding beta-propeller fold protein YncE